MKSASLLRFPVTPSGAALRSLPTGVAAKLDQPFLTPSPPFLTPSPPFLAQAELAGRLVEVTGQGASARISWLAGLVAAAQREGETVAWLQLCVGSLYPPDLVRLGIDLTKLSVALLPDATALLRGADILLRTGGVRPVHRGLGGGAGPPHRRPTRPPARPGAKTRRSRGLSHAH